MIRVFQVLALLLSVVDKRFFSTAVCDPMCENGGTCTAPNMCNCTAEWTDATCETRNEINFNLLWKVG